MTDDLLTARERRGRHRRLGRLRIRRALFREIRGDLMKVVVREIRDEVVHWRILPAAFAEVLQLVVDVVSRFAGKTREIIVVRAFAVDAVTCRATLNTRCHGVRRHWLGGGLSGRRGFCCAGNAGTGGQCQSH